MKSKSSKKSKSKTDTSKTKKAKPKHYNRYGYIVASQSWYYNVYDQKIKEAMFGKGVKDNITIFDLDKNNESSFEFAIDWHEINGQLVPQLNMFDDSWRALKELPEFFQVLAKYQDKNPSPNEIIAELKKLKFIDRTERTRGKVA